MTIFKIQLLKTIEDIHYDASNEEDDGPILNE